jgi:biopolymer transport protein ExbD
MGRKTPGLNTSSMSDISFLLLAFFLLVSNINTDQGIARRLPPPLPKEQKEDIQIKERNIFVVKINFADRIQFNGELGDIHDLKDRAKEFLGNPNNDPNLPERPKLTYPC